MKNKAVELRKSDGMTKHVYTFNSKISSYFTDKNSLCISLIRNKGTGSLILKLADNKVSALYKAGYPADMIFTLKSKLCIISKNKIHIIDLKTGKDLFSFENNFTFIKRGKYFLYTVYKSFGFALNKYVLKSCVYKLLSLKRNSFILKGGIIIK
jgi:hypothetical protein